MNGARLSAIQFTRAKRKIKASWERRQSRALADEPIQQVGTEQLEASNVPSRARSTD
jgi:hypothetical protein